MDERSPLIRQFVARGRDRAKYARWQEQIAATGYCTRPVRLTGRTIATDPGTGEQRLVYSSANEPDGCLYTACGTRRASRCQPCAYTYQWDAYHLVVAGLRGGKGVPATVKEHPTLLATFTAPSFGHVHSRRETDAGKPRTCRPHEHRQHRLCPHGRRTSCYRTHRNNDPKLGEPLCSDCFRYDEAVLWNALASQLWRWTPTYIARELARLTGIPVRRIPERVRVSFVKVAEPQQRGAIHFHAVIRLDAPPNDEDTPGRPSAEFSIERLTEAVRAAVPKVRAKSPRGPDGRVYVAKWGEQLDVQPLYAGPSPSAEAVAGYVAKYATKEPEGFEALNRRITCEGDIEVLSVREHIRRLVVTTWALGGQEEYAALNLRLWAHQLGFRGHWLTKSRRYSTTFAALRQARRDHHRQRGSFEHEVVEEQHGIEQVCEWVFVGAGYRNHADAWLADSARRSRQLGREVLQEERARSRAA
ncbi:MAG: replication initiation protein [Actinomycetota bacterium]|nr:replication initiation protein [Actinomycetota bacterium]